MLPSHPLSFNHRSQFIGKVSLHWELLRWSTFTPWLFFFEIQSGCYSSIELNFYVFYHVDAMVVPSPWSG